MTSLTYAQYQADREGRAFLRGVVVGGIGTLATLWLLVELLEAVRGWVWN
jgi:hypothetical protein